MPPPASCYSPFALGLRLRIVILSEAKNPAPKDVTPRELIRGWAIVEPCVTCLTQNLAPEN